MSVVRTMINSDIEDVKKIFLQVFYKTEGLLNEYYPKFEDYVDFCTLLSDEVEFTKLETDGAYTFVMPEKDIIISAKLTKYEITSTSQYFEVERTAIAGETVFITMHQDYMKIYEPVISGVDLMKINDDTYIFVMPENNVSIEDRLIRYSITTSSLYTLSTNMAGYGEEVTITMKTGNVGLYKPVSTDVEITEESLGVYKFTMIASEVEIQFEKIYYSITNMATEFNATVDKEYSFVKWKNFKKKVVRN